MSRDDVLEQARVLFGRILAKRSEKSILLVGPGDAGKTDLLNEIADAAKESGFYPIQVQACGKTPLVQLLLPHILLELDPDILDLQELLLSVAEAAGKQHAAVAILIDDMQELNSADLRDLVMSMHRLQQLQLPLVLVGAGLPTLTRLVGDSQPYSERLFNFINVGLAAKP